MTRPGISPRRACGQGSWRCHTRPRAGSSRPSSSPRTSRARASPSWTRRSAWCCRGMGETRRRRGALIGLGNVAVHGHLPGWRARGDCEIVAATDVSPARQAECRARLPAARWHDSVESLLAGEALDFVDICTPPSSHAALIEAALARGVHVLCEKPLVGAPEELARLAGLARSADAVLHTVHNWHHAPLVRATAAATLGLHFRKAVADVVLTWAADSRANRARVIGTAGRIDIEDDTLVVTAEGREERRPCPPALSDGSQHPDWFTAVADEFLARVEARAGRAASANLEEAAVCVAIECLARESSRRGGERLALRGLPSSPARAGAAG